MHIQPRVCECFLCMYVCGRVYARHVCEWIYTLAYTSVRVCLYRFVCEWIPACMIINSCQYTCVRLGEYVRVCVPAGRRGGAYR